MTEIEMTEILYAPSVQQLDHPTPAGPHHHIPCLMLACHYQLIINKKVLKNKLYFFFHFHFWINEKINIITSTVYGSLKFSLSILFLQGHLWYHISSAFEPVKNNMMQIPREYKVISTKQYQQVKFLAQEWVMLNILVEKGLNSYSPQKFLT